MAFGTGPRQLAGSPRARNLDLRVADVFPSDNCHAIVMLSPCCVHASVMLFYHAIAMLLSCYCHVIAMPPAGTGRVQGMSSGSSACGSHRPRASVWATRHQAPTRDSTLSMSLTSGLGRLLGLDGYGVMRLVAVVDVEICIKVLFDFSRRRVSEKRCTGLRGTQASRHWVVRR